MKDADKFMQEEFLPFCKRVCDAFEINQQPVYKMVNGIMSGRVLMGMRLLDNGGVIGEYTLIMDNVKISGIDNGVLSSEVRTPFGIIKPYCILEKKTIEKMIQDEPSFITHPIETEFKYYPEITIKFLK